MGASNVVQELRAYSRGSHHILTGSNERFGLNPRIDFLEKKQTRKTNKLHVPIKEVPLLLNLTVTTAKTKWNFYLFEFSIWIFSNKRKNQLKFHRCWANSLLISNFIRNFSNFVVHLQNEVLDSKQISKLNQCFKWQRENWFHIIKWRMMRPKIFCDTMLARTYQWDGKSIDFWYCSMTNWIHLTALDCTILHTQLSHIIRFSI